MAQDSDVGNARLVASTAGMSLAQGEQDEPQSQT